MTRARGVPDRLLKRDPFLCLKGERPFRSPPLPLPLRPGDSLLPRVERWLLEDVLEVVRRLDAEVLAGRLFEDEERVLLRRSRELLPFPRPLPFSSLNSGWSRVRRDLRSWPRSRPREDRRLMDDALELRLRTCRRAKR